MCCESFSTAGNLATHMRTHSGERPHVCETCGNAFSTSSNLARHMRSHSGEKPYVCERCCEAFSQSGNLARHMQTFAWPGTCGVNPESLREILREDSEVEKIVSEHLGESDEEMDLMELWCSHKELIKLGLHRKELMKLGLGRSARSSR
ncbi:hypothetical protein T484DRAFT_1637815 [Baffinella frigidus]|nr:hypothetical protein T484DRAFT_1637815 [Cryptophyta sp. CCMP2293]